MVIVMQHGSLCLSSQRIIQPHHFPILPDKGHTYTGSLEASSLSNRRSGSNGQPGHPRDVLKGMHVLVAEDNQILQRLTKTQLSRLGATVVCVENGAEASQVVLDALYRDKTSSSPAHLPLGHVSEAANARQEGNKPFDLVLMDCEVCLQPSLQCYDSVLYLQCFISQPEVCLEPIVFI